MQGENQRKFFLLCQICFWPWGFGFFSKLQLTLKNKNYNPSLIQTAQTPSCRRFGTVADIYNLSSILWPG